MVTWSFISQGSILLLSAEKRNEISSKPGLMFEKQTIIMKVVVILVKALPNFLTCQLWTVIARSNFDSLKTFWKLTNSSDINFRLALLFGISRSCGFAKKYCLHKIYVFYSRSQMSMSITDKENPGMTREKVWNNKPFHGFYCTHF